MEQKRFRITSNSTRNQIEFQPDRRNSLWKRMWTVGEKLQESNIYSFGEQISHRGHSFNCDVYCRADIERKTVDSSQFWCKRLGSIDAQSLLAWQQERLLTLSTKRRRIFGIIESSSDKFKHLQISYGTVFVKNIRQLWITGKNGNLRQTKLLKKAISFGWSNTAINADIII